MGNNYSARREIALQVGTRLDIARPNSLSSEQKVALSARVINSLAEISREGFPQIY